MIRSTLSFYSSVSINSKLVLALKIGKIELQIILLNRETIAQAVSTILQDGLNHIMESYIIFYQFWLFGFKQLMIAQNEAQECADESIIRQQTTRLIELLNQVTYLDITKGQAQQIQALALRINQQLKQKQKKQSKVYEQLQNRESNQFNYLLLIKDSYLLISKSMPKQKDLNGIIQENNLLFLELCSCFQEFIYSRYKRIKRYVHQLYKNSNKHINTNVLSILNNHNKEIKHIQMIRGCILANNPKAEIHQSLEQVEQMLENIIQDHIEQKINQMPSIIHQIIISPSKFKNYYQNYLKLEQISLFQQQKPTQIFLSLVCQAVQQKIEHYESIIDLQCHSYSESKYLNCFKESLQINQALKNTLGEEQLISSIPSYYGFCAFIHRMIEAMERQIICDLSQIYEKVEGHKYESMKKKFEQIQRINNKINEYRQNNKVSNGQVILQQTNQSKILQKIKQIKKRKADIQQIFWQVIQNPLQSKTIIYLNTFYDNKDVGHFIKNKMRIGIQVQFERLFNQYQICDVRKSKVLKLQLQRIYTFLPDDIRATLKWNYQKMEIIQKHKVDRQMKMISQLARRRYFAFNELIDCFYQYQDHYQLRMECKRAIQKGLQVLDKQMKIGRKAQHMIRYLSKYLWNIRLEQKYEELRPLFIHFESRSFKKAKIMLLKLLQTIKTYALMPKNNKEYVTTESILKAKVKSVRNIFKILTSQRTEIRYYSISQLLLLIEQFIRKLLHQIKNGKNANDSLIKNRLGELYELVEGDYPIHNQDHEQLQLQDELISHNPQPIIDGNQFFKLKTQLTTIQFSDILTGGKDGMQAILKQINHKWQLLQSYSTNQGQSQNKQSQIKLQIQQKLSNFIQTYQNSLRLFIENIQFAVSAQISNIQTFISILKVNKWPLFNFQIIKISSKMKNNSFLFNQLQSLQKELKQVARDLLSLYHADLIKQEAQYHQFVKKQQDKSQSQQKQKNLQYRFCTLILIIKKVALTFPSNNSLSQKCNMIIDRQLYHFLQNNCLDRVTTALYAFKVYHFTSLLQGQSLIFFIYFRKQMMPDRLSINSEIISKEIQTAHSYLMQYYQLFVKVESVNKLKDHQADLLKDFSIDLKQIDEASLPEVRIRILAIALATWCLICVDHLAKNVDFMSLSQAIDQFSPKNSEIIAILIAINCNQRYIQIPPKLKSIIKAKRSIFLPIFAIYIAKVSPHIITDRSRFYLQHLLTIKYKLFSQLLKLFQAETKIIQIPNNISHLESIQTNDLSTLDKFLLELLSDQQQQIQCKGQQLKIKEQFINDDI